MQRKITLPLNDEKVRELRSGDSVLLSGVIYQARDAAHKRMVEALDNGIELPIDIRGQTIYYICLLYTSPSPRDQRGSRMPSSA